MHSGPPFFGELTAGETAAIRISAAGYGDMSRRVIETLGRSRPELDLPDRRSPPESGGLRGRGPHPLRPRHPDTQSAGRVPPDSLAEAGVRMVVGEPQSVNSIRTRSRPARPHSAAGLEARSGSPGRPPSIIG